MCGPPAAGKSTWVRSQARPGDQVIDFDALCRTLGSRSHHDHPPHVRALAKSMRRSLEEQATTHPGRTFVIRSLADPSDRAAVAERLGARVVMFAVPAAEALERARGDNRPEWTDQAIRSWWDRYRPSPADESPET
ncbi:AAA family ATPase [Actinomadura rubrisoli]|uniref:AAA family ATPase n=1 Tax=Actinomadura rubrisoli TaxID=2530368 RepID=UPI0014046692|nr:AAA family ATPase [Actinomadura rubrisoli]